MWCWYSLLEELGSSFVCLDRQNVKEGSSNDFWGLLMDVICMPLGSLRCRAGILAALKPPSWRDHEKGPQRGTERCLRSLIFSRHCSILPSPDSRHVSEETFKDSSLCHHRAATSWESPRQNHSVRLLPNSWLTESMKTLTVLDVP